MLIAEQPNVAALVRGYKGRAATAGETGSWEATIPNIRYGVWIVNERDGICDAKETREREHDLC